MARSHTCGQLRREHIGETVTLNGWVWRWRDHGGLVFIDLRDRSGVTQIVFSPEESGDLHGAAHRLRSEFVLEITGRVRERPEGTENPSLPTGEVEVVVSRMNVLNESKVLPFQIEDDVEASENLRFRHRYLDLRRPRILENLRARHRIAGAIRRFLDGEGFMEVETPVLTKSTPEGARDYLVPSRVNPGAFFALPQSPQLFKQILMVGGLDRYYQIVRCFRDEDLRADRQPEFTQVDMEMSFVGREAVMGISERMIQAAFEAMFPGTPDLEFPRLSYAEAMERYGSDKPDLRFGLEIRDVADLVRESSFKVFLDTLERGDRVRGLRAPGLAGSSRKELDVLTETAQSYGAKGLAWVKCKGEGFESPIAKFFPAEVLGAVRDRLRAEDGDLMVFVADRDAVASQVLGRLRLDFGKRAGFVEPGFRFVWVTDFPLLEFDDEERRWVALHHPFTACLDEDLPLLDEEQSDRFGEIRSQAYDLVLNGYEVGGGSIRIHRPEIQKKMFSALGIGDDEAREKFGFLIEALAFGAPPHGGIAFGLDRLVMLMVGAESIRDVIAFPKTQKAVCPLSEAPSTVDGKQLRELYLRSTALPKPADG